MKRGGRGRERGRELGLPFSSCSFIYGPPPSHTNTHIAHPLSLLFPPKFPHLPFSLLLLLVPSMRSDAACEEAYFKMNNVLIDDRRIKCDFSQSVSHLWKQFKK
jgi:hypothetical protein